MSEKEKLLAYIAALTPAQVEKAANYLPQLITEIDAKGGASNESNAKGS